MASAVLSAPKVNVYDAVTTQIVAAIEKGAGTSVMPWHGGIVPVAMPLNAFTEMPYRGVNVVSLWAQATMKLYPSGYWASYEQWRKLGAQVRKGERGSLVIFYKKLDGDAEPDASDDAEVPRVVVRHSHVFNFAQVDGWELPNFNRPSQVERNEQIAAFIEATKADIRHGGQQACYSHNKDYIAMPPPEHFRGTPTSSPTEAYYAVLLHELTHWTGASRRLDRVKGKRFGDRDYAFEELVAELGAAFLCSAFRLVNQPRPDHAAYISHWLGLLNRDNRAIFAAASLAQQAVEYLRVLAGGAYAPG
ncbi:MAG: zincin-like metallopeptidase domain-containing protein [Rhizomicrobium sp.]